MNRNLPQGSDNKLSFEHTVVNANDTVNELAAHTQLNADTIREALAKGAVWLSAQQSGGNKFKKPVRIRKFEEIVKSGDKLLVNYDAAVLGETAAVPELISDQVNYSIWYKPPGVFSQGTRWGDHCSMPFLVEVAFNKPAYLVHRLDRAASGLMVLAHTKNALHKLTALFAARKIVKHYQARIEGQVDEALPLDIDSPVEGKAAHTRILESGICDDATSILTLSITTGRKHQIRSHLSSIGHPVLGDRLFCPGQTHRHNLQLVAVRLVFQCPFTESEVAVNLPKTHMLDCASVPRSAC